jgi:hypothetical protein
MFFLLFKKIFLIQASVFHSIIVEFSLSGAEGSQSFRQHTSWHQASPSSSLSDRGGAVLICEAKHCIFHINGEYIFHQ